MAIVDLLPESAEVPAASPSEARLIVAERENAPLGVKCGIHDASRFEWSVSLELPEAESLHYELEAEIEIPANSFVRHSPWAQLQFFTRLDAAQAHATDALTIDALRREALAHAHFLSKTHEEFSRYCRMHASLVSGTREEFSEEALQGWVGDAVEATARARQEHARPGRTEAKELARERKLVDEYISVRFLEFLASAERTLVATRESRAQQAAGLRPAIERLEARVAQVLESEFLYRRSRSFIEASSTSLAALERYLERSSALKKHFQEVLFLETETVEVAEKIHHIVAAVVAVLASTWAFFWQIALVDRTATSTGGRIGSGILLLAVLAGFVYAGKDRIKEVGRDWISGRVRRLYAQRVARFRLPARRTPRRDVVASAKESFDDGQFQLPDPLNPECGGQVQVTKLRYRHKGEVLANRALVQSGVLRLKHVFRYDLSPIFSRLDDATKQVPVFGVDGRVRFVDAPRSYRVPVRVSLKTAGHRVISQGVLIMHKRGLDRLEFEESSPDLVDAGPEPHWT